MTINPDGTLHFAPAPGFVGEATITYLVSDGQGGTATATVKVTVDPEDRMPRLAPPTAPTWLAAGPSVQPSLEVPGAVLAAANGELLGGLERQFAGAFTNMAGAINADPPLIAAVNEIVSLGGLQRLSDTMSLDGAAAFRGNGNAVGQQAGSLDRHAKAATIFQPGGHGRDWSQTEPEGLGGFSLRFGTFGSERDVITVESLVRRGTLMLEIGSAVNGRDGAVSAYRITALDGSPLPDWLRLAGPDLVLGKVPAGVESIAIRVTAEMSDGEVNTRDIVVQTRTGEIQPASGGRRAEVVPLFSRQLASRGAARDALTFDEVQILGRALAGGRR